MSIGIRSSSDRHEPTYKLKTDTKTKSTQPTNVQPAAADPVAKDQSQPVTVAGRADARARFSAESGGNMRAFNVQTQFQRDDPRDPHITPAPDMRIQRDDPRDPHGTPPDNSIELGPDNPDDVSHSARDAPAVDHESQEWGAVTSYIYDEIKTNADSGTVDAIEVANNPVSTILAPLGSKATAYALWAEKVGPGREWDHKGAIQNEYGLRTQVPGKPGEISWDVWSNIHYGFVGKEAGFSDTELKGGADLADLASNGETSAGDEIAIQIGIDLYNRYGADGLTPERIQEEVIARYDDFGEAGKIYGDPRYTPEGWKSPYSRE